MAILKVIGGSYPNQDGDLFLGHITVKDEHSNFIRYCPRGHNVTLEIVAEDKKGLTFKVLPKDGSEIIIKGSKRLYQEIEQISLQPARPEDIVRQVFAKSDLKKLNKKTSWQVVLLGLIGLLLVFWWTGEPSSKGTTPEKQYRADISDAKIMVPVLCEERVREGLKAPRSAKFPWDKNVEFNGAGATMTSYVDAQNSFGALIRTNYFCSVRYSGGKPSDFANWSIVDFRVLE